MLSLSDADGDCRVSKEYRLIADGKRFTFEVLNQGSNDRNECTKENDCKKDSLISAQIS